MDQKHKIEAVLFSAGKRISAEDIAKNCKINIEETKKVLLELKNDIAQRNSPLTLIEEGGDVWKLSVIDEYLPLIQNVVAETDLDKSLMETLAVIAWKYPIVQADVIKIRHNKAYEHMKQLDDMGFISKEKFGRTFKLKLTPKFFNYFDLPSEKHAKESLKGTFGEDIFKEIEEREAEIENAEVEKTNKEKKKQELENVDIKVEEKKDDVNLDKELEDIGKTIDFDGAEEEVADPQN